jgi:hypothetical protein
MHTSCEFFHWLELSQRSGTNSNFSLSSRATYRSYYSAAVFMDAILWHFLNGNVAYSFTAGDFPCPTG